MPIDVEKVLGAELPEMKASWDSDDVILYHLGIGAGVPPTDANELRYAYEKDLQVLPSYGIAPILGALIGLIGLEGMDINLAGLLHGEQELTVHEPLATSAEVITGGKVAEIWDKGKAALVVLETVTRDAADDRPLYTNRWSAFFRGEGGFGGESGPSTPEGAPDRDADHVVIKETLRQQALLYRLSGDKNPLHADPDFAKLGGFDEPILHGLCSYGMALKAVVDTVYGGDASKVGNYKVRFAGVLFPGESLEISMWEEGETIALEARCPERDAAVLSHGAVSPAR